MRNYIFYRDDVRTDDLVIGSSDIPIIIKTPGSIIKKSTYELWEEKSHRVDQFSGNEKTAWGHDLEPLLISRFIKQRYDRKTAHYYKIDYMLHEDYRDPDNYDPPTSFHSFTECRHPEYPWAIAHADCIYTEHQEYNIEAKSGGYYARVKRNEIEGFDLTDLTITGVPSDVLLQIQWQMFVYDLNLTYVLLLVDTNRFFVYEVPAIKKWWPLILEKVSYFYNCCKNDTPPQPEKYSDVSKLFPDVYDRALYVTGERATIIEEMRAEKKSLQKKIKKYESRIDDINNAAGILMQDNKYLYNGETGERIFQQVISNNQFNLISPVTIEKQAPDAYKILNEKGLIKTHNRRFII